MGGKIVGERTFFTRSKEKGGHDWQLFRDGTLLLEIQERMRERLVGSCVGMIRHAWYTIVPAILDKVIVCCNDSLP